MEVSQTESQQLRQERDALREEVQQLHVEDMRLRTERTESAPWLAAMMPEIAARFPITPPPA
jgi:hypothetical protein